MSSSRRLHSQSGGVHPACGRGLLLLFPRRDRDIRVFSLVISLLTFAVSLHLPAHFHRGQSGFQFEVDHAWIPTPNIHYHLGVDGVSMWLVLLTTFLTPLCVLISWKSIHERVKEFFIILLILESALIGVFLALDLFLFYFFWESTLIPMALLIGMFGHGRRIYAAVKFFLYTMIASVFMLAAILWLYAKVGSFDFVAIGMRSALASRKFPGSGAIGSSWASSLRSRSKCHCSPSIPGCPTPTWKHRLPARCYWPASC